MFVDLQIKFEVFEKVLLDKKKEDPDIFFLQKMITEMFYSIKNNLISR